MRSIPGTVTEYNEQKKEPSEMETMEKPKESFNWADRLEIEIEPFGIVLRFTADESGDDVFLENEADNGEDVFQVPFAMNLSEIEMLRGVCQQISGNKQLTNESYVDLRNGFPVLRHQEPDRETNIAVNQGPSGKWAVHYSYSVYPDLAYKSRTTYHKGTLREVGERLTGEISELDEAHCIVITFEGKIEGQP